MVVFLVSELGIIQHETGRADELLDASMPTSADLFRRVRAELRIELRQAFVDALRTGEDTAVPRRVLGELEIEMTVRPMTAAGDGPRTVLVMLDAVRRDELDRARAERRADEMDAQLRRTRAEHEEMRSHAEELEERLAERTRLDDDLHNLLESTEIATLFLDRGLRLERYTRASVDLFGLVERDRGRSIHELPSPFVDSSWIEDLNEVIWRKESRERPLHAEATRRWYMLRAVPYRTAAGSVDGVVASFVDVTEMKRQKARAEELAAIVESSKDAIVARAFDGTITSWNRGAEALFGYTAAEAVGQHVSLIVPADRLAELAAVERRALTGFAASSVQTVRLRKHGGPIHVSLTTSPVFDDSGRCVGVATIARDITSQRRAEEDNARLARELRRAVDELHTVLELAPIGIAVAEDPQAARIRGNRAALAMLGVPPGTNLGALQDSNAPFHALAEGRPLRFDDLPVRRVARDGESVSNVPLELVFPDGERRHLSVSAVPLLDEDQNVRGSVAALVDVTYERRAASALATAAKHKDEFLALLGHELRNPLGAIATAAELLRRKLGSTEGLERPLEVLDRQLRHVTRLVDDLLDLARVSRGLVSLTHERVDLAALVRSVVEDHRGAAETAGLELVGPADDVVVRVVGDRVRLVQIVVNLLGNALAYTERGGRVELEVCADERTAMLVVRDSGVGIGEELLARLFEPFAQGPRSIDRSQGGLGLGLALCRRLAELHGGSIHAASEGIGRGASFEVRLPLDPGARPTSVPPPPGPVAFRARRVLLIEDQEDNAELLRAVFEHAGHVVEVAFDGASGVELARAFAPEVVVCDIGLPGELDGFGVARRFRADPGLCTARLVALSGYARAEDRARAAEAGFDLHMKKPPDVTRLEAFLASID